MVLLTWIIQLWRRVEPGGDEGSPTLETVIIAAALAAVAIAATALIVTSVMTHAGQVK